MYLHLVLNNPCLFRGRFRAPRVHFSLDTLQGVLKSLYSSYQNRQFHPTVDLLGKNPGALSRCNRGQKYNLRTFRYMSISDETRAGRRLANLLQLSRVCIGGWNCITIDGVAICLIQLGPFYLAFSHQIRDVRKRLLDFEVPVA